MAFLEDYEKIQRIGEGAFATVYKVRHAQLDYIRALKVSKGYIEDTDDKAWQTFMAECKMLLRIGNGSHPNIVRIYQPRLLEHRAVVEMDCVEGESLHDYVKNTGFVPVEEFYNFAHQIVGAVAYCHVDLYKFQMDPVKDHLTPDPNDGRKYIVDAEKEKELIEKYGVVHNDLHSANIIRRDYDGQYVLLDFGLAIQDTHCVKSSSRFDGAIEYCAPEKLERGLVQPASDVYALGILLYEMLAGQVPFPYDLSDGTSPESARNRVYQQQLNEAPAPILPKRKAAFEAAHPGQTYTRDYSEAIEAVIMRCLAKDPADRYPNAKAHFTALEQALKTQPAAEPKAPQARVKPEPPVVAPSRPKSVPITTPRPTVNKEASNNTGADNGNRGGKKKNSGNKVLVALLILLVIIGVAIALYLTKGRGAKESPVVADTAWGAAKRISAAPQEKPEMPAAPAPVDKNIKIEKPVKSEPKQEAPKSDTKDKSVKTSPNKDNYDAPKQNKRESVKKEVNDKVNQAFNKAKDSGNNTATIGKAIFDLKVPSSVYYGDRFTVQVRVENLSSETNPSNVGIKQNPKIDGCTLLSGPTVSTISSYEVKTGKKSNSYSKVFIYTFRADRTGETTMTAVGINVDGRVRYLGSKKIYIYPPKNQTKDGK